MAEDTERTPKKRGRPRKDTELATMDNRSPVKQMRNRPDLAKFG